MSDSNGEKIDLAHVEPFMLGAIDVDPPHRSISIGDERVIVEPRAMQCLVALYKAEGKILSHDDLIAQCWDGRVVGDNAIHRAISRVRELSALGTGSDFSIETVKGVGYALHRGDAAPAGVAGLGASRTVSRRTLILGGSAAAAAAGAIGWWQFTRAPSDDPIAAKFAEAEQMRRQQDLFLALPSAEALYREIIGERPDHAPYRGAYALLLCQKLENTPEEELPELDEQIADVAAAALAIDPDEPMARAANLIRHTPFRRWDEAIAELEPIASRRDGDWQAKSTLSDHYADIGQWVRSSKYMMEALDDQPLLRQANVDLVHSEWGRGRLDEAKAQLEAARQRWPRYHYAWLSEFFLLAQQGELDAARSVVENPQRRPVNLSPNAVDVRLRALDLMATPSDQTRQSFMEVLDASELEIPQALSFRAMMLALVGEEDAMLDVIRGQLLGEGEYGFPLTPYSRRRTAYLYMPLFDPYRSGGAFRAITERLGLPSRARV